MKRETENRLGYRAAGETLLGRGMLNCQSKVSLRRDSGLIARRVGVCPDLTSHE